MLAPGGLRLSECGVFTISITTGFHLPKSLPIGQVLQRSLEPKH
jgi:hypothetical protein